MQPETENQTPWVERTGKLHQATQSCMQAWDQHGHDRDLQQPQIPLFLEVGRENCHWTDTNFFFPDYIIFSSVWPKGKGTQSRGSPSQLNAVLQHEMFTALDSRAAGEEAPLHYIGEAETWSDTLDWMWVLTHIPVLAAQWQSLQGPGSLCVCSSHAQLLHCCPDALPSRSSVLLSCSILIASGYLSKLKPVSWWNFWQAVNNRSIINSCQMGLKCFLFILPKW